MGKEANIDGLPEGESNVENIEVLAARVRGLWDRKTPLPKFIDQLLNEQGISPDKVGFLREGILEALGDYAVDHARILAAARTERPGNWLDEWDQKRGN